MSPIDVIQVQNLFSCFTIKSCSICNCLLFFFYCYQTVLPLIIYCSILQREKNDFATGVNLFWQQREHMKSLISNSGSKLSNWCWRKKNQLPQWKGVRCQPTQPTQLCELPWHFQFKDKNKRRFFKHNSGKESKLWKPIG